MTVEDTSRSTGTLNGDGVTTIWSYSFEISDESEAEVLVWDGTDETWTTLTTDEYSITGIGDEDGGNVTYPISGDPLESGDYIVINRTVPYTQTLDVPQSGDYDSSELEAQLDRMVWQTQQVRDSVEAGLTLVDGETFSNTLPPKSDLAGKVLQFDDDGEPEAGPTSDEIENAQSYAEQAQAAAAEAGAPYESRTIAEAADVDSDVDVISVLHAGELLRYQRDASGTALTTNDGATWSPAHEKTVKHYGAFGDGSTDDSSAISTAITDAAGGTLIFNSGGNYYITSMVTVTDISITIIGYGATITQGADVVPFRFLGNFTNVQSVSSIDNDATVDVSDGDAVTSPVASLTFASDPGYSVGDLLKVVTNTAFVNSGVTNERWGEPARVVSASGTTVYLSKRFLSELPTLSGTRCGVFSTARVVIRGLTFDTADAGDAANWTSALLQFRGLTGVGLVDIHVVKAWAIAIETEGCHELNADRITGGDATNDPDNSRFGYLINDASGFGNMWNNITGHNCRHVYTTNCNGSSGDADLRVYGQTIGCTINNGMATDCTNTAWDTHHDALYVSFNNCTAIAATRGHDSVGAGFQIRGGHVSINNGMSLGTKWGVQILQQYSTTATNNARINGFKSNTPRSAILVNGQASNDIVGIHLRNLDCEVTDEANVIEANYCEMRIEQSFLKSSGNTSDVRVVFAGTDASIIIKNTMMDVDDQSGTTVYLVMINTDTSDVRIYDGVECNGAWGSIFDFNSLDGTGMCYLPVHASEQPSNTTGYLNLGSGPPIVGVDYTVGLFETSFEDWHSFGDLNSITFDSAGAKTVDLEYRSGRVIYVRITCTNSSAYLWEIDNGGVQIGQIMYVQNRNTSTQQFEIRANSDGGLALNTGEFITIGRGMGLIWNGSIWTPISGG